MVNSKEGQMKIQQMALMIIAVFIFFVIAGLFVLNIKLKGLGIGAENSAKEETEALINLISTMTEFNYLHSKSCSDCLDGDKLAVMTSKTNYSKLWPIASLKVHIIHPPFTQEIKCPSIDCNYYEIMGNYQNETKELSSYVNVCHKKMEDFKVYDDCELAKVSIGVRK